MKKWHQDEDYQQDYQQDDDYNIENSDDYDYVSSDDYNYDNDADYYPTEDENYVEPEQNNDDQSYSEQEEPETVNKQNQRKPIFNDHKEPNKPNKKQDHFIYIVIGAIILIIIFVIVFFVSLHQRNEQAAKQAANSSSSTVKIQKLPDSDDSNESRNTITADTAKSNVNSAIKFAFKVMAQVKSTSGSSMDLTQLSDADAATLSKLFTTSQVLQDFNDTVNISGDDSTSTYGDAGTGIKKVKHPKAGNKYAVKGTDFKLNSDDSDNYVFSVKLQYKPKGFKTETIHLIISVSKSTGKLTEVKQQI